MPGPQRIGFCGAHSTGKSTLATCLHLATGLPLIEGVTRQTPLELRGTHAGQSSILLDYVERFAIETIKSTGWICDRTLVDVCCYSIINNVWGFEFSESLLKAWKVKPYAPTHIIYFPIEFPMIQDGQRPSEKQREEFDACAKKLVFSLWPNALTVNGSVGDRLDQVKYYLESCS